MSRHDPAPDVMMAGRLGPRRGHGAGTEGSAVIKGVLSAVEAPGGLGADGPRGPEGGGQVTHLERHLQRPVGCLAARGLLVEGHSEQSVQLLVAVLPHVHDHLLYGQCYTLQVIVCGCALLSLKFLFSLAHLILSRLLLEALGPCCRHDEVVAVARYFVSCLLITVLVAGSCARSPHQISQSPLAAHRRSAEGGRVSL